MAFACKVICLFFNLIRLAVCIISVCSSECLFGCLIERMSVCAFECPSVGTSSIAIEINITIIPKLQSASLGVTLIDNLFY